MFDKFIGVTTSLVPLPLCVALWPDIFHPEDIETPIELAACVDPFSPSAAVLEAHFLYWVSYSDCLDRFPSYSHYLRWLIDVIGGDAPAFSAAFLDELHKLERPSSSLRL